MEADGLGALVAAASRAPSSEIECHCWVRLWEVRSCILSSKGSPMDRRTFNTALMSAAATSLVGSRSMAAAGRTVWYQGVGNRLTQWDVDVDAATLRSEERRVGKG